MTHEQAADSQPPTTQGTKATKCKRCVYRRISELHDSLGICCKEASDCPDPELGYELLGCLEKPSCDCP